MRINKFHTSIVVQNSLRRRSARFLLHLLILAQLVGPLSAYAAEVPPPLPPAAVKHLHRLHRDRARVSTGAQELSFELRLSLQSGISKVEREWTDGALLGLPGTLEITQGVIQKGYSEIKRIPRKPVAVPAIRAAEAAAWEFARRFVPAAQFDTVVACLDNDDTSEDEKLHCALTALPRLAAETPFTVLPVSEQVATLKIAIGLRPQNPPPTTDGLGQLTSEQFWAAGIGLFKAWKRVADSETTVLKEFKEDAQTLQTKLGATLSNFAKRAQALETDAKRIADLNLATTSPRYQKYIKDAQGLLYDQLALESMTSGMVPAAVIDLANAPKDLQEFAKQLTTSSENVSRILEESARGALKDLIPSADALSDTALSALGLPKELRSVADVINGGDPAQLLAGPVLEAVGLPPELGGIAVAIGTGNYIGAVASFADMAGLSLGGLAGGGGGGAEMAEIRKELGAIREQLREISAKLDQIDRKIDALRELVIAQHAEVMAKLDVLGEEIDAIRRANRDALRRITKNCDVLVDRIEETERLSKRRGNYSQLASVLTNEEIGPFERCWTTIQDTASQRSSNTVFTLGLSEGALNARDKYTKNFLAPHTHFFREAFDSQRELQRATLLLGAGENSLRSASRRRELVQSTATLDRRRLFAAEVLEPRMILDYEAVREFTSDALLAVSLRPFINLRDKWMVSLDCALGRRGCLDKTADDNYIQIMSVLRGCLALAETGVAQTAVLDGDLVLPFAIDVIQDPTHDEYEALTELMVNNEVFAANVAIAVLRSALAPVATASADIAHPSYSSDPIKVLGSLYSFAVETSSPAMMDRLIDGSSPEWAGLSFFVRDGNAKPPSCTYAHQGLGLYMRLPNGICLQMPLVKEVQMGTFRESPDSHAFRELRRRIMDEIVGYEFRRSAPAPARDWIDRIEMGQLN